MGRTGQSTNWAEKVVETVSTPQAQAQAVVAVKPKGKSFGEKLTDIAATIAKGMYGPQWTQMLRDKEAIAKAQRDAEWEDKVRQWKEEDRPAELRRIQMEDAYNQWVRENARTTAERQGTQFEQSQEDRKKRDAAEIAQRNALKSAMAVDPRFKDVLDVISNADTLEELQAIMDAAKASSKMKSDEAYATQRLSVADWNRRRPTTSGNKKPAWTTQDEIRLQNARKQIQAAVLDGQISEEEGAQMWQSIQEEAKRQKDAAANAMLQSGGANVDASSLPGQGGWQGVPYRRE